MEIAWEKEREEQKRLLKEAHDLTLDLQVIPVWAIDKGISFLPSRRSIID